MSVSGGGTQLDAMRITLGCCNKDDGSHSIDDPAGRSKAEQETKDLNPLRALIALGSGA